LGAYAVRFFFAETKQAIVGKFPNLYDGYDDKQIKAGAKELLEPYGWLNFFNTLAQDSVLNLEKINKIGLWQAMAFMSLQISKGKYLENLSNAKQ
jgi:hypothetical protein